MYWIHTSVFPPILVISEHEEAGRTNGERMEGEGFQDVVGKADGDVCVVW